MEELTINMPNNISLQQAQKFVNKHLSDKPLWKSWPANKRKMWIICWQIVQDEKNRLKLGAYMTKENAKAISNSANTSRYKSVKPSYIGSVDSGKTAALDKAKQLLGVS